MATKRCCFGESRIHLNLDANVAWKDLEIGWLCFLNSCSGYLRAGKGCRIQLNRISKTT